MKKIILFFTFMLAFAAAVPAAEETMQSKQISSCERIGYPEWRDECFESLGRDVLSYSVCLKISSADRRERCLTDHPPKSESDCLIGTDSDSCLRHLKEATKDITLCQKIKDHDVKIQCYTGSVNEKDKNIALEFIAKQQQDKSICDLIDSKSSKSSCVTGLTTRNTVEGCEAPATVAEFKQCKQFTLLQQAQMKNMQKAPKTKTKQAKVVTTKPQTKGAKVNTPKEIRAPKVENIKEVQKTKAQLAKEAREAKAQEAADKLQAAKDERATKLQADKDAKEQMKAYKYQEIQDAKNAKADGKATKLQEAKDAREAKDQESANKIQAAKDAREAKAQESADKIQAAKDAREAKAQEARNASEAMAKEKAEKLEQAKEAKKAKTMKVMKKVETVPEPMIEEKAEDVSQAAVEEPIIEQTPGSAPEPIVEQKVVTKSVPQKSAAGKKRAGMMLQAKEEREARQEAARSKAQAKADEIQAAKDAIAHKKADKIQAAKDAKEAREAKMKQYVPTEKNIDKTNAPATTGYKATVNMGKCTKGFGSWTEPPQKKSEEISCDKENVDKFAALLNRCIAADRDINILSYDMNKDLCVTCDDLKQWQKQVKKLYDAKKRSTDGKFLKLKECAERKF